MLDALERAGLETLLARRAALCVLVNRSVAQAIPEGGRRPELDAALLFLGGRRFFAAGARRRDVACQRRWVLVGAHLAALGRRARRARLSRSCSLPLQALL